MAPAPSIEPALRGLGVPADLVHRLALDSGLAPWHPDGVADRVIALLGGPDSALPKEVWEQPFVAWIDARGLPEETLAEVIGRARRTCLFARLTTALANELHLAGRFAAAIDAIHPFVTTHRDDIELALHEAISNAVVHGNLQVEGMKGLSVAALDQFSNALAERMADPSFSGRCVEVTATIEGGWATVEVGDEGSGFSPEKKDGRGASGRGLDLIGAIAQSVELLDGGRRIRMRFAL